MTDALNRLEAAIADRCTIESELGSERFFREIKITANLSHPHILPLLDSGRAVGRYGGSMKAIVKGRLRPS
jgi:serine/threonine protein kinase